MIIISELTQKSMDVFKGKKVFIYSYERQPVSLFLIFKFFKIDVISCSIYKEDKTFTFEDYLKNKIRGMVYIKSSEMKSLSNRSDVIAQPLFASLEQSQIMRAMLEQLDIEISPMQSGEILAAFSPLLQLKSLQNPFKRTYKRMRYICKTNREKKKGVYKNASVVKQWNRFKKMHPENSLIICSPPKTADNTMTITFDTIKKNVETIDVVRSFDYINLWHLPNQICRTEDEKIFNPLKILMGVREPVSQNLSCLYQCLGGDVLLHNLFVRELFETNTKVEPKELVEKYKIRFAHEANVQSYWDVLTNLYVDKKLGAPYRMGFIQEFILEFNQRVIDITEYPFDVESGYTIIKEGNTEVFVYQLEKLDGIVPELSEWIGVPFDHLLNANQANDKWIATSYKQAQKEIEITQEYFDKCFNEPYVKHCYSEADIELFKMKWRSHIK